MSKAFCSEGRRLCLFYHLPLFPVSEGSPSPSVFTCSALSASTGCSVSAVGATSTGACAGASTSLGAASSVTSDGAASSAAGASFSTGVASDVSAEAFASSEGTLVSVTGAEPNESFRKSSPAATGAAAGRVSATAPYGADVLSTWPTSKVQAIWTRTYPLSDLP